MRRRQLQRRRLESRDQLQSGNIKWGRCEGRRFLLLRWNQPHLAEAALRRLHVRNLEVDLQIHRPVLLRQRGQAHRDNLRDRPQLQRTHFEGGRQLHRSDFARERDLDSRMHAASGCLRCGRGLCGLRWTSRGSNNGSRWCLECFRHGFDCCWLWS